MLFQRLIVYSIVSWYTNVGSIAMDCAEGTKLKGVSPAELQIKGMIRRLTFYLFAGMPAS